MTLSPVMNAFQHCAHSIFPVRLPQVQAGNTMFLSVFAADAPQQILAAALMNEVCGKAKCDAVIGLGDNFYPCGADDPKTSGLNRCGP